MLCYADWEVCFVVNDKTVSLETSFSRSVCLQVVNGAGQTRLVEFYPLLDPELRLPPPLGEVAGNRVLAGSVSDDTCRDQPCSNNGNCSVTWNDFRCESGVAGDVAGNEKKASKFMT